MTKDEALKLALEVMQNQGDVSVDQWIATEKAIKEALAQPEPEYLAFMDVPHRPWVGLTDEERIMCRSYDPEEAVAKTEAKLKEKNT